MRKFILLMVLGIMIVSGCASPHPIRMMEASRFTQLEVKSDNPLNQPYFHDIDKVVTDQKLIKQRVKSLNHLKKPKKNAIYNCPSDDGTLYHLTFYGKDHRALLKVKVERTGCENITIKRQGYFRTTEFTKIFTKILN